MLKLAPMTHQGEMVDSMVEGDVEMHNLTPCVKCKKQPQPRKTAHQDARYATIPGGGVVCGDGSTRVHSVPAVLLLCKAHPAKLAPHHIGKTAINFLNVTVAAH